MSRLLFLPLLLTLFFSLSHSQELCHPNDINVLLRIKSGWGNPASLSLWDPNVDCCQWNNLICDDEGHIVVFRVSGANDIHGHIPPYINELYSIAYLYFNDMANLSGPIPSSITKLKDLIALGIVGTNVGGSIPSFIGELQNLEYLQLSGNKHKGRIPVFLSKLKSLRELDLSFNGLTGPIPLALGRLSNLISLVLNNNKLSGPIPDFPSNQLMNLNSISIQGNRLSGPIPLSLGRKPFLVSITASDNKLTGDASFLLDKNNTGLQYLNLNNNLIKFDFTNVDLARNIGCILVSYNLIYGSLPLKFGLINPLAVDVSYNQLCGPIPNGRRFKLVDPQKFAHNKCLCGGPLRPCKA